MKRYFFVVVIAFWASIEPLNDSHPTAPPSKQRRKHEENLIKREHKGAGMLGIQCGMRFIQKKLSERWSDRFKASRRRT